MADQLQYILKSSKARQRLLYVGLAMGGGRCRTAGPLRPRGRGCGIGRWAGRLRGGGGRTLACATARSVSSVGVWALVTARVCFGAFGSIHLAWANRLHG